MTYGTPATGEFIVGRDDWTLNEEQSHGRGLSRKVILFEMDQSLCRPQTDYVDLYQIHR